MNGGIAAPSEEPGLTDGGDKLSARWAEYTIISIENRTDDNATQSHGVILRPAFSNVKIRSERPRITAKP